jgi:predicted acetyltransferase
MPEDGLYESFDFKSYFEEESRKAYLVRINGELAGFVLIHQTDTSSRTNWNMGEFFIIAKFQGQGIGERVTHAIWAKYPGVWEISVIPENNPALSFWEKAIKMYVGDQVTQKIKKVDYDEHQPKRVIFRFDTNVLSQKGS